MDPYVRALAGSDNPINGASVSVVSSRISDEDYSCTTGENGECSVEVTEIYYGGTLNVSKTEYNPYEVRVTSDDMTLREAVTVNEKKTVTLNF